jgi:hypothetical protein
MVFLTHVIDPIPTGDGTGVKPQSELPLSEVTPRLLVGNDPTVSYVPSRLLVTPLCRGGRSIVTPELLDLVAYAIGKKSGWSTSTPSTSFDIENGSFELPLLLVPEEPIQLWTAQKHMLYQAPLYTIMERSKRLGQLTLVQEVAFRNNIWASNVDGETIESKKAYLVDGNENWEKVAKNTWPIMRKAGHRYGVEPITPEDLPKKLFPHTDMLNYY